MGQTRLQSLLESSQNIGVGFFISYLGTLYFVFPIQKLWDSWFGVADTATLALVITGFYTVLSVIRHYCIRRYHNWKLERQLASASTQVQQQQPNSKGENQ